MQLKSAAETIFFCGALFVLVFCRSGVQNEELLHESVIVDAHGVAT